jgi:hypothetical protein
MGKKSGDDKTLATTQKRPALSDSRYFTGGCLCLFHPHHSHSPQATRFVGSLSLCWSGNAIVTQHRDFSHVGLPHHFSTIFTFAGSSAAGSAIWGSGGGALLSLALLLLTFLPAAVPSATTLYVP